MIALRYHDRRDTIPAASRVKMGMVWLPVKLDRFTIFAHRAGHAIDPVLVLNQPLTLAPEGSLWPKLKCV